MLISIIVPVLNEELYIENCLKSILNFDLPENISTEIFILDGNSEDNTVDIINTKFKDINVISNPKRIQSTALNIGINKSKGDYILRLDAHSTYPKTYLKDLYETSLKQGSDNTGGVVKTHPGGSGYGAQIVQALTTHIFGVGNSGFRLGKKEGVVDTVPFGFFKREIFDKVGLFDERLARAQDYEFNRRIINSGGKIWLNPKVIIEYYNQKYFNEFLKKQFVKEGPYNAYMWYLAPYTFSFRHLILPFFTAGVIIGGILSFLLPFISYIYFSVIILYFSFAILASIQQALTYKKPLHLVCLPLSFFLFHFLYGAGTIVGLFKLIFKKSPVFL